MTRRDWFPLGTQSSGYSPPTTGDLIAREHAVWRVEAVADLPLDADDREKWMEAGAPDPWHGRPYEVHVVFVGGARPTWAGVNDTAVKGKVKVPASAYGRHNAWPTYPPSGRWPQCSCCGEPMPCRAELQDRGHSWVREDGEAGREDPRQLLGLQRGHHQPAEGRGVPR